MLKNIALVCTRLGISSWSPDSKGSDWEWCLAEGMFF